MQGFQILKRPLLITIFIAFLGVNHSSHADFHEALRSYQNRDAKSMLDNVKKATITKNNDGLMLFLSAISIDQATSSKIGLYRGSGTKRAGTFQTILTKSEQEKLLELLMESTASNIDAQFYLSTILKRWDLLKESKNSKLSKLIKPVDKYVSDGSVAAISVYHKATVDLQAKIGDPYSQLLLGLSYFRTVDGRKYNCEQNPEKPVCQPRDVVKGEYWLKEALKNYEKSGHADRGPYYNSMCDLLQKEEGSERLREAFLWCLMGINTHAELDSWRLLDKMHLSGKLKVAAPKFDNEYPDRNWKARQKALKKIEMTDLKTFPDWVVVTREEIAKNTHPVFTYYVNDYMEYELNVYASGKVTLGFGAPSYGRPGVGMISTSLVSYQKDVFLQVKPKDVKSFLNELDKLGFYQWKPLINDIGFCDNFDSSRCIPKRYNVTVRAGARVSRLDYIGLAGYLGSKYKNIGRQHIAKISTLIEKYFPTQKLRCELGTSVEYQRACIERDDFLAKLASENLLKLRK